jgi:hypothetical protein
MKMRVVILALLLPLAGSVNAQEEVLTVPTAVPFLRISPDPRAAGMADVSIAMDPDPNSCFINPAKLAFSSQRMGFGLSYTPWFSAYNTGQYLAALSFFSHLSDDDAISVSLRYFNTGTITSTDNYGNIVNTYKPKDFSVDAAYSLRLNDYVSVSTALRFIYSKLVSGNFNGTAFKAGKTVAADLTLYTDLRDEDGLGWTGGISLNNLGGKIGYTDNQNGREFIPATLAAGAGYTFLFGEDNALLIAGQVEKLLVPVVPNDAAGRASYHDIGVMNGWVKGFSNNANRFALGVQFDYQRLLYLRAGYSLEPNIESYRNGFTAGVGFRLPAISVNMSYLVPSMSSSGINPLNNTLRFGAVLNFESVLDYIQQRRAPVL